MSWRDIVAQAQVRQRALITLGLLAIACTVPQWVCAQQPTINPNGVVNGAGFQRPVVAGSVVSAFGNNLSSTTQSVRAVPLPTTLGGATMQFNGNLAVPLFFASPAQINFQVPWELTGQAQATLTDTVGALTSSPVTVQLAAAAPGISTTNSSGNGQGLIFIAGTDTLADSARPAFRGETVSIYCTGLGDVNNRPATGATAPLHPPQQHACSPPSPLAESRPYSASPA